MSEITQKVLQDDGSLQDRPVSPHPPQPRVAKVRPQTETGAWTRKAFEALRVGHLYREEGEPVPCPEWVIGPVMALRETGRVNMLSPELVAHFVDSGKRYRNPAVWILEHRDEYVSGVQHGFLLFRDCEDCGTLVGLEQPRDYTETEEGRVFCQECYADRSRGEPDA